MVLEGGSRFGSTLALPASHDLDGAAEVGWWSFNGGALVWIDVELTGAASSWLGDGGKVMVVQIGIGVGPFLASSPWGFIGGGCRSFHWFWCCSELVMAAPGGATKVWSSVLLLLPVSIRFRIASFGGWIPMMAFRPFVFLYFSLLRFQIYVLDFGYCLRLIVHGWIICHFHVMAIDRLVWVWADDGGPMVILLPVSGSGIAGKCGFGFPRPSLLWSATCFFYYVLVLIFSCILFPTSPCSRVSRFYGLSFCCHTLCFLSVMERWRTIIKWLLPPSVRMKWSVLKLFNGFGWMHKEMELLTSLLCLCGGEFSLMDNCYLKTNRVANCALIVFRASVYTCMVSMGLGSLSLLLRVLFCMFDVMIHEVRFYAPLVVYLC